MSEEQNKPVKKFRIGGVSATVWDNVTIKDSKEVHYFTVTVERTYKSKDEFKKTSTYGDNDLPKLMAVSRMAYDFVALKKEE